jgi:hypothetical protein
MDELSPASSREFQQDDMEAPPYQDSDDEAAVEVTKAVKTIEQRMTEAKITAGPISIYSTDLEEHLDRALKKCRIAGSLNTDGPPNLTFALKCIIPDHKVNPEVDKGFFLIQGSELGRLNQRQMATYLDECVTTGCGYEGCRISLIDALNVLMEEEQVLCYECRDHTLVVAGEGCQVHPNTKCESLVAVALGQIAKWFRTKSVVLSSKGVSIPFILKRDVQLFIVDIINALKAHPVVRIKQAANVDHFYTNCAHLEYGSLVKDLSIRDIVVSQASQAPSADSLTETVRLLEAQKELNTIKKVTWDNTKLKDRKRKSDVMSLQFDNFKRRKVAEVGNRGPFETNRKLDVDMAGLIGGFSDILASQPFYTKTLTVTKDTLIPGISETNFY